jgi:hypothetical protein
MTTPQLEKVYFNWILKNPKYFSVVKPIFFRNTHVQFVYRVIRDYMITNTEAEIPSPRQILDMVSLEDKEGNITKEILKSILKVNLKEYDAKSFIEPNFNGWVLSNRIKIGSVDVIEQTRTLDDVNTFDSAVEAANRIKGIVDDMSSLSFVQDDDLGSDFDEPENHIQDNSRFKVKTGFKTIDHILGGGWDIQTLNCIMAETNNGKCTTSDTEIRIRNKNTGKIDNITIGDLFNKVKNQQ